MNKILAIVFLALAMSSCVPEKQAHISSKTPLATASPLASKTPLATQEVAHITGSWHLRQKPSPTGESILISDCDVIILKRIINPDMSVWLYIDVGGVTGYVNAQAVK